MIFQYAVHKVLFGTGCIYLKTLCYRLGWVSYNLFSFHTVLYLDRWRVFGWSLRINGNVHYLLIVHIQIVMAIFSLIKKLKQNVNMHLRTSICLILIFQKNPNIELWPNLKGVQIST